MSPRKTSRKLLTRGSSFAELNAPSSALRVGGVGRASRISSGAFVSVFSILGAACEPADAIGADGLSDGTDGRTIEGALASDRGCGVTAGVEARAGEFGVDRPGSG